MAPPTSTIHSILKLPKSATRNQINKAYKKAARAAHPDKGGNNKAMAALNAAKDAYDKGGVTETDISDGDDGDNSNDDGGIDMNDNESDEDYHRGEDPLSDGESVSGPKADANGSESESEGYEEKCAFDSNYGDNYQDQRPLRRCRDGRGRPRGHHQGARKDLRLRSNDPDTPHFLQDVDDDTDSGVEDLDAGDDDSEDEAMVGEEVDHIDEGFEHGDGDD